MDDIPLTRRGILSSISSTYDPLGCVAPFLLKGRIILQQITSDHYGWDDNVTDEQRAAWTEWRKDLPLLNNLQIQRCFNPISFGNVVNISLHHFADGSVNSGYGTSHYIRQVDEYGKICVSLAMGKSRVSPLKLLTIPRIELTAANTAAVVGAKVRTELDFSNISEWFWSDSMVALGYIRNERKRFRIFVSNRVSRIRALSDKEQWNHVESDLNPADHASRGISAKEVDKVNMWFRGPSFLWEPEHNWKEETIIPEISDYDTKVKINVKANITGVKVNELLLRLEERISHWQIMVRVLAIIIKFCKRCRKMEQLTTGHILSVFDLKHATVQILKMVQGRDLMDQLVFYNKKSGSDKRQPNMFQKLDRKLWKLDPFINTDGLLKVGARMNKSHQLDQVKYPVILPKIGIAVQRLVEYHHQITGHGGRTLT